MKSSLPIKMNFAPEFFEEEERCGYRVTSKTKRIWAVELDLMTELLRVCKKYGIEVYAYAGTLLGAVRHKGFIPWDDDMDVCMTRENYEKLIHVASDEFVAPYFFQTAETDRRFFFGYARLRNSETTGIIFNNRSKDYNNGIYIDIFVLDGVCENLTLRKHQLRNLHYLARLANAYYTEDNNWKTHILKKTVCKIVSYERVLTYYKKEITKYNGTTERVSTLYTPKEIEQYGVFVPSLSGRKMLPYENIMIPVPENYGEVLSHTYGDYLAFPPVEERGEWHSGVLFLDPDRPYVDYL